LVLSGTTFLIIIHNVVMENTPTSVMQPDLFKESRMSIHSFLMESIVLPINNFLKDIAQMDKDFKKSPNVVSISEAVYTSTTMEENY